VPGARLRRARGRAAQQAGPDQQALLPEARATLAAAQAAQDAVAQAQAGLRGTLTVGTMMSTGHADLPELLGRFHSSHPGVAVHLRQASAGSAELAAR
jgi:DNA-binding transcriptional LysR family regulator